MEVVETLKSAGIIPVIVIEDEAQAVPLANALVNGGLPVLKSRSAQRRRPVRSPRSRQRFRMPLSERARFSRRSR